MARTPSAQLVDELREIAKGFRTMYPPDIWQLLTKYDLQCDHSWKNRKIDYQCTKCGRVTTKS
ncbi:hypothetical protein [Paenibacillus qinlingensis]|uniref:hypothetical protein n=1 Tax=Paenibacillus qinlingensis TaxID=1837343 RepID=UPI001566846B|nr:hypothetical protein [Paenibacillus qinlingensis]NQX57526.1 hypothetical protein [Paenibacillus qinlingensis]